MPKIRRGNLVERSALSEVLRQAIRLRRTNAQDESAGVYADQAWEVMGDLDRAVDRFLEVNPEWRGIAL